MRDINIVEPQLKAYDSMNSNNFNHVRGRRDSFLTFDLCC